ncbi:MAG: penicillin-binding protein 2 [Bacteroidaceae bacterium]
MRQYDLEKRKYVIGAVAIAIVFIYMVRLFTLQIMSDDYKRNADSNAFLKKIQYPSRGLISDRNGKLLVYNEPAYNIMVIMTEQRGVDTLAFCNALGITKDFYIKRMLEIKDGSKNLGYSRYTQQVFLSQIPAQEFSSFQEKLFKFKGFYVEKRSIRHYAYNNAAHVLGDVGEVSPSDIEKAEDKYYQSGDYVGKLGVERSYEKELRGEKGIEILLRDVHGRIKGHYLDGSFDRRPVPGKNLTLGLDAELQKLGEYLMNGKIGTIVAIEPKTGEVLCMVSSPSYNPAIMVGRNRGKNQVRLGKNPWKPLLNRTIMGQYPPGSTFKATQALTYLQEGIVSPSTQFPCYHGFNYGRLHVGCHSHSSPVSLVPAIATSCNSYFCWGLFRMLSARKYGSVQKALTRWKDYMVSMGFGYRLGIDLPGEKRGMIPNAAYYDKAYKGSWNGLTVISISIGQGEVNLTPLQITNLAATIANRGTYIVPHVVRNIENGTLDSIYRYPKRTMVDPIWYRKVIEGMRSAVLNGTCKAANLPGIEVCGKTGTAQNHGHDHSIFMGFAPMNSPKIAISVYVENGGFGAVYGVPIGALMMEKYINGKLSASSQLKAESFHKRAISYGDKVR